MEEQQTMTEQPADVVTTEEFAAMHDSRAFLYGLLSRIYRVEVDPVLLDQLKSMRFPASTGNDLMDSGYRKIAKYVGAAGAGSMTELAVDYVRAFIGHGIDGHAAAYPFESVYTSEKRLMMQASRDEVLAVYRSEGIDKREDWKEGEDHVALELEFMRTMAQRSAEALRAGNPDEAARLAGVQNTFLNDHLMNWIPTFARDMRIFAKTDLYLGLADLTEGFLREDRELLSELA